MKAANPPPELLPPALRIHPHTHTHTLYTHTPLSILVCTFRGTSATPFVPSSLPLSFTPSVFYLSADSRNVTFAADAVSFNASQSCNSSSENKLFMTAELHGEGRTYGNMRRDKRHIHCLPVRGGDGDHDDAFKCNSGVLETVQHWVACQE